MPTAADLVSAIEQLVKSKLVSGALEAALPGSPLRVALRAWHLSAVFSVAPTLVPPIGSLPANGAF